MRKTVLILMVLVLVLVGILFWQKNNISQITNTLQQQINSLQNQIANLQGKSSNPTGGIIITNSDEPAGWKTFANNDYGFTINYPGNWIVKSITQSSTQQGEEVVIQNLPEVNLGTSDLSLKVEGSFFQVEMYKTKSGDKTIRDWINSGDIPRSVKQDRLKQIVNMFIAGENREVWTNSVDWSSGVEFVDSSRFCRLIYMSGSPEQFQVDSTIFQQMLNSFKFTK